MFVLPGKAECMYVVWEAQGNIGACFAIRDHFTFNFFYCFCVSFNIFEIRPVLELIKLFILHSIGSNIKSSICILV